MTRAILRGGGEQIRVQDIDSLADTRTNTKNKGASRDLLDIVDEKQQLFNQPKRQHSILQTIHSKPSPGFFISILQI